MPNTELYPTLDRVLVRPAAAKQETAGGIIIPEGSGDHYAEGVVVKVGEGRTRASGGFKVREPVNLEPGDTVLYSKVAGIPIKWNGEKLLLMREEDILAVVVSVP